MVTASILEVISGSGRRSVALRDSKGFFYLEASRVLVLLDYVDGRVRVSVLVCIRLVKSRKSVVVCSALHAFACRYQVGVEFKVCLPV